MMSSSAMAATTDAVGPAAGASAATTSAASPRSEAADSGNDAAASASGPTGGGGGATRKRVFTFQKRWLHTLPIMEKVLPENVLDAASVAALKAANLLTDDGKPVDDAGARDVIVCMLCDDPNASREMLKIWSRVNCRRGRIENHLMSKHPEFMLLLKQKRETEGDLAVQIFLQNMREGRCNVRSEISAGLYSHMQPSHGADVHIHKRAFGHDEFMMPTTGAASAGLATTSKPHSTYGQILATKESADALELEKQRKRAKLNGRDASTHAAANAESTSDAAAPPMHDILATSLLSYRGPAAFAQWRQLLANKMVVITGGERPIIARIATSLWLLGANVLVTFSDLGTMEAFSSTYLAQFHTAEGVEPPRGVMLPLFCSLHTASQIEEWSRSIATKFDQVDYLINFVDESPASKPAEPNGQPGEQATVRESGKGHTAGSTRPLEICQIFGAMCMQRSGRNAVINITTETSSGRSEPTAAAAAASSVETVTKSLATSLRATNVQVNCIVAHQAAPHALDASSDRDLDLLHAILFLLSPASVCISGSVVHHHPPQRAETAAAASEAVPAPVPSGEADSVTPAAAGTSGGGAGGGLTSQVI